MANRYLVAGGSGLWNATDTNNWSATSGGGGGASCPTSSDDVFLDAGSAGASIGCQATATAANVDCTGFTGTFSWGGAVSTTWGGSWTFSAGMTVNGVAFSTQVFTGTGTHTITSAGKQFGNFTINSSGGSYTLQDALTVGASGTATLTFTRGTLDTNGNTVAAGGFSSNNGNTRTLTLGASALNMSTTAPWNVGTTNLTLTANTSVVTCSASGASFITWQTFNWNGMSLVFTGGSANTAVATNLTFANFTFTGTAIKTGVLTLYGNITTTGTLTINGNSTTNRVLIASNTVGTARTITAATVSCSNVDFMDITGAGAGSWNLSAITGLSGDCGGNSGITFTAPTTQTRNSTGTRAWSDATSSRWTSRVPLPQDDVIIDGTTTGTTQCDMPRLGKNIDFTGHTGTVAQNIVANTVFGSLTLASGMTLTSTQAMTLGGRSSYTLTSAGKSFGSNVNFNTPGGTYTLQDALTLVGASNTLQVNSGTFTANNFSVTAPVFVATGGTINMGTGTWTVTFNQSAGFPWQMGGAVTVNASTSNVVIGTAAPYARTFSGGGKTYHTLTYTVANSPGSLTIYNVGGANTFNTINVGSGRILTMPSAITTTVTTNFNVNGVNNGYIYLPGIGYLSAPDSAALSMTGDMDFRQRMSFNNISAAAAYRIAAKYITTGNQRTWRLYNTTGSLTLDMSTTGADSSTATASVSLQSLGLTSDTNYWIRFTREQSTGNVKFYYAADSSTMPASWTQIGTTQVATTSALYDSTALLTIGMDSNAVNPTPGRYYQTQLRNNILDDGTGIQFDADMTTKTVGANTFTEGSSNAATVTVNDPLAQVGDGRVSIVSSTGGSAATISKTSGQVSCDYLTVQDSTAATTVPFYAGANGVLVSGTTNWNATAPPSASSGGNMLMMGV